MEALEICREIGSLQRRGTCVCHRGLSSTKWTSIGFRTAPGASPDVWRFAVKEKMTAAEHDVDLLEEVTVAGGLADPEMQ